MRHGEGTKRTYTSKHKPSVPTDAAPQMSLINEGKTVPGHVTSLNVEGGNPLIPTICLERCDSSQVLHMDQNILIPTLCLERCDSSQTLHMNQNRVLIPRVCLERCDTLECRRNMVPTLKSGLKNLESASLIDSGTSSNKYEKRSRKRKQILQSSPAQRSAKQRFTRSDLAYFDQLPKEILWRIFKEVLKGNVANRHRLMKVCSSWYHILRHPDWWSILYLDHPRIKNGLNYMKSLENSGLLSKLKVISINAPEDGRYSLTGNPENPGNREPKKDLYHYNLIAWLSRHHSNICGLRIRKAIFSIQDANILFTKFSAITVLDLSSTQLKNCNWLQSFGDILNQKALTRLTLQNVWNTANSQRWPDLLFPSQRLQDHPSLQVIDLSYNCIPSLRAVITSLPKKIRGVSLRDCQVVGMQLNQSQVVYTGLPELRLFCAYSLKTGQYPSIRLAGFLVRSPKLRGIDVCSWPVMALQDIHTLYMPRLYYLSISAIHNYNSYALSLPDHQILLPQSKELRVLSMSDISATPEWIESLLKSMNSEKLRLLSAGRTSILINDVKKILECQQELNLLVLNECHNLEESQRVTIETRAEVRKFYAQLCEDGNKNG